MSHFCFSFFQCSAPSTTIYLHPTIFTQSDSSFSRIIDETDVYVDSSSKIRVVRPAAATQDRYRPLTSSQLEEGSGVGSLSKVFEGIVRAKVRHCSRL